MSDDADLALALIGDNWLRQDVEGHVSLARSGVRLRLAKVWGGR